MKASDSRYSKCLYFTTNALARKVDKLAQESWKKVNLSPSHAYLLMMVIGEPGIQPKVLAEHLQLQPSTITRLMEKLELKKLVIRTTEGKLTNVYPTPKAKEILPRLNECLSEFYSRYAEILGKEESGRFVQNMVKITDKLGP
jgi:MarR family transcriptional regulator, organic hydroperoxide resistance regulator